MKRAPRTQPDGTGFSTKAATRKVAVPAPRDDDDDELIGPEPKTGATKGKKVPEKGARSKRTVVEDSQDVASDLDFVPTPLLPSSASSYLQKRALVPGTANQARILSALRDAGRAQFGSAVMFSGEETHKLVVAIPLPSIALEWLLGVAGFPLGLFIQLVAETGVGKSAFLAEIARWFFMCGGGFWLNEAETKFNPSWYQSILRDYFKHVYLLRATSQEDWQRNLTKGIKITKEMAEPRKKTVNGKKVPPGFGRAVPFLFGVDSLTGKSSESHQEKILGELGKDGRRGEGGTGAGIGGYSGMQAAGKMTDYIRSIAQEFDLWPFSLVVIGQLKQSLDENMQVQRKIAGGQQVKFQQAMEFQLSRSGGPKHKIVTRDFAGHEVDIETFKNSWGEGVKKLKTRVLWRFGDTAEMPSDPEDLYPAAEQKTIWDWDWSLTWLLDGILNGESGKSGSYPMLKARLKDLGIHVKIKTKGHADSQAWSTTLGQTEKECVSCTKLGRMLQSDPDIVRRLRKALCIEKVAILSDDYAKQVAQLVSKAK